MHYRNQCPYPDLFFLASFFFLEHFQFETRRASSHTAWRFAGKARFFRLVSAGRTVSPPRMLPFFKGSMLQPFCGQPVCRAAAVRGAEKAALLPGVRREGGGGLPAEIRAFCLLFAVKAQDVGGETADVLKRRGGRSMRMVPQPAGMAHASRQVERLTCGRCQGRHTGPEIRRCAGRAHCCRQQNDPCAPGR